MSPCSACLLPQPASKGDIFIESNRGHSQRVATEKSCREKSCRDKGDKNLSGESVAMRLPCCFLQSWRNLAHIKHCVGTAKLGFMRACEKSVALFFIGCRSSSGWR